MTDTDTPEPTAEYSYTAVTHSRQLKQKANSKMNNNGIEMNSCVAYGTTAWNIIVYLHVNVVNSMPLFLVHVFCQYHNIILESHDIVIITGWRIRVSKLILAINSVNQPTTNIFMKMLISQLE